MNQINPVVVRANASITIPPKKKRAKVLWWSDFLRSTGFGNVAEEIVSRLHKTGKYEIIVLGINYTGIPYCSPKSEYYHLRDIPVYPANTNGARASLYGYDVLEGFLLGNDIDIFFALQDSFNLLPVNEAILEAQRKKNFKYILYFPVDGDLHKEWITDGVALADYPVVYSKFGESKVKEIKNISKLKVIPHGVDLDKFKPFDSNEERDKFRREYFGFGNDTVLISNVNRNQPRKDLPRTILAFKKFCEDYPEVPAKLYLHCFAHDGAGHELHTFTKKYLPEELHDRIILPKDSAMVGNGVSVETIRCIYAASDIITSTTLGEGWGLSLTESMACKTPVVFPANSAITEIIGAGQERGYLVKSGAEHFTQKYDNELMRPLTDINDLVRTWKYVLDNPEEAAVKADEAYTWLQDYTWDKVVKRWEELFDEAYKSKCDSTK